MRLIIAIIFCLSLHAENRELLAPDPVLQGIWMLHATADAGGVNVTPIEQPFAIARLTPTRFIMEGGNEREILRVGFSISDDGVPGNFIITQDRMLWCSKRDNQQFVMIQIFNIEDPNNPLEMGRWVVVVHQ